MQRVQKILSNYGYCSRRKAEELIKNKRVKVNKKIITIGDKASPYDIIYVNNKLIKKPKKIYIMFNKPIGCVTALSDKHKKTIMDYIKTKQRIFPIGRLDYNTSGLLILTNDGDFSNSIMHPRYEINKTYRVTLDKPVTNIIINKIEKGIVLKDGKSPKAKVKIIKNNIIDITIHQGKNRIIRRIVKKLGFRVKNLERIKIGKLSLGNLKPSKYRKLTKKDKENIKK